jgi:hypothetical protein
MAGITVLISPSTLAVETAIPKGMRDGALSRVRGLHLLDEMHIIIRIVGLMTGCFSG